MISVHERRIYHWKNLAEGLAKGELHRFSPVSGLIVQREGITDTERSDRGEPVEGQPSRIAPLAQVHVLILRIHHTGIDKHTQAHRLPDTHARKRDKRFA